MSEQTLSQIVGIVNISKDGGWSPLGDGNWGKLMLCVVPGSSARLVGTDYGGTTSLISSSLSGTCTFTGSDDWYQWTDSVRVSYGVRVHGDASEFVTVVQKTLSSLKAPTPAAAPAASSSTPRGKSGGAPTRPRGGPFGPGGRVNLLSDIRKGQSLRKTETVVKGTDVKKPSEPSTSGGPAGLAAALAMRRRKAAGGAASGGAASGGRASGGAAKSPVSSATKSAPRFGTITATRKFPASTTSTGRKFGAGGAQSSSAKSSGGSLTEEQVRKIMREELARFKTELVAALK